MGIMGVVMALIAVGSFVWLGVRAMLTSEDASGTAAGIALVLIAVTFAVWFVLQR